MTNPPTTNPDETDSVETATTHGAGRDAVRRHGLPEVVRALKTFSARRINEASGTPGEPAWQRGYYDRIVRNEKALRRMRAYIDANPIMWTIRRARLKTRARAR